VALMLLGFASFPIFTRVFSVSDYGTLNLIQNVVLLLTVLAKFGFQHSVQRYYPEHAASADPLAVRRYYSTLFFGTGILGLLFSGAFIAAVGLGFDRYLGFAMTGTLLVATALVVVRSLRSMQLNLMQMENKTKLYNIMETLQKVAVVGLTVALLFSWSKSILSCFLGMIVVEGGVMLQYIPILARRGLVSFNLFDTNFFRAAAAFSFPLMMAEISWVVLAVGDRFFVQHYLGAIAVGYYAAAYSIATYVQEVMSVPLQLSFFPICMKLWASEGKAQTQKFLSRSLNIYMMVAVLVVCVALATSRDVVIVLASKKFAEARTLLPYLVIGLVLSTMNTFFRPGLMIHKQVRKIAQSTFLACVLNVILNIVLLPRIGLMGAALATTLSFAAMVGLNAIQSLRILPFKIEWVALVRYLAIGLGAFWVASRIVVESPMVDAILKGAVILALYAGTLWLTDSRARELFSQLFSFIRQSRSDDNAEPESLAAAAEN
jgi:O-antigen/teichoic acid export membrane protein